MTKRYQVFDNTEHRCCHEACVRDTTQPTKYSNRFALVCECHDTEMAQRIADAMNSIQPASEAKVA